MKFLLKGTTIVFFSLFFIALPGRVWAQDGSPLSDPQTDVPTAVAPVAGPAATANVPKGIITGKIVNKNDSSKPVGDLEVMLHLLDQDQNQLGMLHGKTVQDGSYEIADVPFQVGMGYVAAVAYEGTTYYSPLVPAEAGKTSLELEVPIYESTTDLAKVQVEQMHVLFGFAMDGMEVKEIYALSNLGDRTVKGGVDIPGKNGEKATVQFLLPEKADFINFQPQDEARFVKFSGGFVDIAPIVPGQMVSQFLVSYLMPYSDPLTYQLKTVLPVTRVNFVVPKESGVTLKGNGLGEPEQVTAQNGEVYSIYKLESIPAGKTLDLTFEGKPVIAQGQTASVSTAAATSSTLLLTQKPVFFGLGILGVVLIGGGAFWWVRASRNGASSDEEVQDGIEEEELLNVDQEFDRILMEIAQLDQHFEQGELDQGTYNEQRARLMVRAKEAQSAANGTGEARALEMETDNPEPMV